MNDMLTGKVAIITGGVRGIGKAIAQKFSEEGADLILTSTREPQDAEEFAQSLRSNGSRVMVIKLDVTDKDEVEERLGAAVKEMGRIDILVNNAGITKDGLILRMSEEDWDSVINVDLKSAFNTIQTVLPNMLRQKSGNVINISSVVGVGGNPGQCNYSAAKAGLIGLSKSLGKEMGAKGIRSNCIAPGFISTDMTAGMPAEVVEDWKKKIPLRRPGKPEEVASVALFLASDMSSYVNAQVIRCCGGMNV